MQIFAVVCTRGVHCPAPSWRSRCAVVVSTALSASISTFYISAHRLRQPLSACVHFACSPWSVVGRCSREFHHRHTRSPCTRGLGDCGMLFVCVPDGVCGAGLCAGANSKVAIFWVKAMGRQSRRVGLRQCVPLRLSLLATTDLRYLRIPSASFLCPRRELEL
ncbi:hypothetical protein B0H16DRAFT_455842 [Mycena metata]|uniref:Uncharacterized protein n=1 Tax=Mycena metata TaxID=1033252 RepID=A0AAD7NJV0_9AGAR|nr:hypothetical protein B0H16DRAFT_455842 [Mycena metata]